MQAIGWMELLDDILVVKILQNAHGWLCHQKDGLGCKTDCRLNALVVYKTFASWGLKAKLSCSLCGISQEVLLMQSAAVFKTSQILNVFFHLATILQPFAEMGINQEHGLHFLPITQMRRWSSIQEWSWSKFSWYSSIPSALLKSSPSKKTSSNGW